MVSGTANVQSVIEHCKVVCTGDDALNVSGSAAPVVRDCLLRGIRLSIVTPQQTTPKHALGPQVRLLSSSLSSLWRSRGQEMRAAVLGHVFPCADYVQTRGLWAAGSESLSQVYSYLPPMLPFQLWRGGIGCNGPDMPSTGGDGNSLTL